MGCAASTASPGLPPLSSEASLAHKPECHPRVLTDLGMRPPHQSTARHSHGTSTATQPHITSMRNSATAAAAAATTTAAPDPLPDPLGQICVPVKETAAATSASPNEHSSTRLSLTQLRPATISHSTILSVQATSSAQSRSHVTASEEKDAAEPQTRTPPSPPMHELQPHTPPQQLHLRDVQEQYRLSEQSMQRSTSLLELIDSLSTTSPAMARHEQHAARRSPTYNSLKRQTSATPPEQTTPPTVQVSLHRASGSTNGNTHIVPNAEKSAMSPKPASLPVDAADGSGLKFEYMAEEGNFDINSSDEDDSDSDSGDPLHIIVSRSTATPTIDRQETSLLQRLPQPPSVSAATAAASPRVSTPAGLGFRLQPIARSASLVSLAEGPDDMFGPSTPHGTDGVRFGSMSPDFNGLPTANNSRPASSFLASTSNVGRVDQVADNGLATFFNQPRECASCKSPTVAFACEVCDDFFLCEDCRFNVAVVRAIHDPTHAMLSIQDNHCGSSRTFGGDSIFSLSGEGGASSLFNPPCSRCGRVIDDTEAVYRCEQCDHVLCLECFFKPPETVIADSDSPHEHILKRFQRKSKPGSVHESVVVSKSRSRGGNRVINDYVVVRLLGRGSYAKVKLVQHIRTQELFALKILKKQKKASTSGMNLGRSRVKMASAGVSEDDLLREIAVMKFIDHPNITKLKEVIEDVEAQKVYVIMEYCENGPVHVLDTPPLELEQVRQYGADIMRGLQHLHSEFLYHRDVKPANCLVNHECVVKIADFGTCNSQIRTKTSDGTLAFSCPEQVRGEEVSGEVVDSWAFALTLYEMAYGTLPVSTTSLLQHRNMLLGPEPIPIPESGDPQLRDLLAAMLRKKLKERVLLSAAAQHPFFRAFQIDPHGSPYNSMQLAASRHQQQLQQSLLSRGEDEASPTSPSPQQQPSPPPQQQQQQQQPGTLSELYSLALESVHRGKNLKDCFHGVRAVRRIRRKEVEMARHGSGDPGLGCADDDDDDDDSGFYAADKDVDSSGVLRSADAGMPSPMHSGAMLYGYGSSADSVSEGNSSAVAEAPSRGTGNTTPSKDGEAVAAAKEVEELVQHHLASKESKIEVSYVQLVQQSTVEKLNQLAARAVDFRLTHNALASITALRFGAFHALKELCISFNRLENFPVEVLAAPRLMRLDLSHNRISSISPALVTNAPFLERLNLHHNFITYVGTVPCGAPTPNAASPASPVKAKSAWDAPRKGAAAGGGGGGAAPTKINGAASGDNAAETRMVSVLAAPCLRHVRLSGNPLEALPLALETTHRLELVLDAIPALMEQWKDYPQTRLTQQSPPHQPQQQQPSQEASANMTTSATMVPPTMSHSGVRAGSAPTAVVRAGLSAPTQATRLPAIIVWADSFPVRIPDVEPAVWLAVNNMAVYRVQTLRTCQARRVVLCQCADPRFPNGVFDSADLEAYFNELAKALQERQLKRKGNGSAPGSGGANEVVNSALPPIVSRAARSYVESYFFVTDDESEEDGGYHSLVEYLNEALAAREPVLVVVMSNANASAVRTNIVAALSTSLTLLRGKEPDDVGEQVEMVVSTMRSLYA